MLRSWAKNARFGKLFLPFEHPLQKIKTLVIRFPLLLLLFPALFFLSHQSESLPLHSWPISQCSSNFLFNSTSILLFSSLCFPSFSFVLLLPLSLSLSFPISFDLFLSHSLSPLLVGLTCTSSHPLQLQLSQAPPCKDDFFTLFLTFFTSSIGSFHSESS